MLEYIRAIFWMCKTFGIRTTFRYELERKYREKLYGVFVPEEHGENLLRRIGLSSEKIQKARDAGLA